MRANADNLVLLPQAVNELLKLERVDFIQIDKVLPGPIYHIRVIDFSDNFGVDGSINWHGHSPRWSISKNETIRISLEDAQWVVRNRDGKILTPI